MGKFRELIAYKKGFALLMDIFTLTKDSPKSEQYSLVDQVRRSSRFVCSSIGEAYKKRRYPIILSVNYQMLIWKTAKPRFG
jgi:four helix bundle protein